MRLLIVGLFVLWAGLATAGSICLTCDDLNYDCVPESYVYDGFPIAQSSCPIPSCTAHCQGLHGVAATGSCSAILFTCICDTGTEPTGPVGQPVPTKAPAGKTTTTNVHSNTVTVTALDFASVRLAADGTLTSGTGFTVALVLVAAACFMAILGIAAYVYPKFQNNEFGVRTALFYVNPLNWG